VVKKDQIYAAPQEQIAAFRFDEQVAEVFPDMIQRSVPGYRMMLDMIGVIAAQFVRPHTHCYDLGCSLGAATLSIRHHLPHDSCRIIAVDNATAMVERCREIIDQDQATTPVEVRCEDILYTNISNASLVVMNFTLMFIPPEERYRLLQKIYQGLQPGGILVLSEKMAEENSEDQTLLTKLYHHFKKTQGYSQLEIAQKRSALENVLIPETFDTHRLRLQQSGFSQVTRWFKCFNFTSLIAQK